MIIGLTGAAMCGKSTIARALAQTSPGRGQVISFAQPLKAMLTTLLFEAGDASAATTVQDKASRNPTLNGHTVRHALQTLGTEWGREQMRDPGKTESMWTQIGMARMNRGLTAADITIFDDVRFEDEANAIRWHAGFVIGLVRGSGLEGSAGAHASEDGIEPDLWIANDKDPNLVVAESLATLGKFG